MNKEDEVNGSAEWTNQTNLQAAEKLKQEANAQFTKKQYKEALKKYHQAILHLAGIIEKDSMVSMYTKTAPKQITDASSSLKFSIWLNMSQIYIFQEKFDKGLEMQEISHFRIKKAEELLQKKLSQETKKKSQPKLFYRKGICYMKLNYLKEARQQFSKLKLVDSSFGKQIQQLERQIQDREKQADLKSKKLYQGFFK